MQAMHHAPALSTPAPFGERLRHWRQRRRLSQLDLAHAAEVSTRHLSCVETGRASPSRDMVLRLAHRLDVPLRERNALLVAAGYAPMYRERPLDAPEMADARARRCSASWTATNPGRRWRWTGTETCSWPTASCPCCCPAWTPSCCSRL